MFRPVKKMIGMIIHMYLLHNIFHSDRSCSLMGFASSVEHDPVRGSGFFSAMTNIIVPTQPKAVSPRKSAELLPDQPTMSLNVASVLESVGALSSSKNRDMMLPGRIDSCAAG